MSAQNIGSPGAEFRPKPPRASGLVVADGCVIPNATEGTCAGEPHATVPVAYDGILLLGFGGPEGQDDVIPFLRNVTAGRGIPDERLEEVAHHYRHFGGVSPINEHNRELKAALDAELSARGLDLPVYWGNRNWMPYVTDAIDAAVADGRRKLLAIATSAYSSYSSCRQYREDLADAVEATGHQTDIQIDKASNALTVSNTALRFSPKGMPPRQDGGQQIYILHDGSLQSVPLTTGLSDGQRTEVLAGDLAPGDLVVTGTKDR